MSTITNGYNPTHPINPLSENLPLHPQQRLTYGQDQYDTRTAKQIQENPIFSIFDFNINTPSFGARFLNMEKFLDQVAGGVSRENLTPRQEADLWATAERVLEHIDKLGGTQSTAYDNKIEGLMPERMTREARYISNTVHGDSELMRLLDFCKRGYAALSGDIVNIR